MRLSLYLCRGGEGQLYASDTAAQYQLSLHLNKVIDKTPGLAEKVNSGII